MPPPSPVACSQMLRHDEGGAVEQFLMDAAARSVYFAHLLVCQLQSEGTPPPEAFNPTVKRSNWEPPSDSGLWATADRVRKRLLAELKGAVRERLEAELGYFEAITAVSGRLYPVSKVGGRVGGSGMRGGYAVGGA